MPCTVGQRQHKRASMRRLESDPRTLLSDALKGLVLDSIHFSALLSSHAPLGFALKSARARLGPGCPAEAVGRLSPSFSPLTLIHRHADDIYDESTQKRGRGLEAPLPCPPARRAQCCNAGDDDRVGSERAKVQSWHAHKGCVPPARSITGSALPGSPRTFPWSREELTLLS